MKNASLTEMSLQNRFELTHYARVDRRQAQGSPGASEAVFLEYMGTGEVRDLKQ